MVGLNLSSDNVRNCEETTMFEKVCKKKGILNLAYKQGHLFEKSKEFDKFKEIYKKNDASKIHKKVRKVSKTKGGNDFK